VRVGGRQHYVALYDYDERFREATEEAEASGRDVVLVEIERGLLTSAELATILMVATSAKSHDRPDPVLVERGKAARKALKAGRHVDAWL
jgi:hypothetical protein